MNAVKTRLVVRDVHKAYGDTKALEGLDLEAFGGEVVGVAGPNGAGKSTLMRILAGEESQDSGVIELDGAAERPEVAGRLVAVVHQEPELFDNLTVAENLGVGRESMRRGRPVLSAEDAELMRQLNLGPVLHRPLGECSLATQQRTEIARALAKDARVFLFDEPNSALTEAESEELFEQMQALAAAGRVVLLVSHRLGDLAAQASRVIVIRDGRVKAEIAGAEVSQEAVARQLVVGIETDAGGVKGVRRTDSDAVAFRLRDWTSTRAAFADVDVEVKAGELVALMGVEGSGSRELLRSVAGLEPADGGIEIDGLGGSAALRRTSYVPATRQLSLFTNFTVEENLLARLGSEISGPIGLLRRRRGRELAARQFERYRVKAGSVASEIRSLSGGNQQKVAIAAAVAENPRVLLLEEPTRGVDLTSRNEIYRLLHAFAAEGNAVVIFCTEVSEVFEVADQVYVVADGRLSRGVRIAASETVEDLAAEVTRLEQHPEDARTGVGG